MNLERFLNGLTKLKRGSTPYGIAPHKPILLLTLLDLLDRGYGADNKFYIDDILVSTFHEIEHIEEETLKDVYQQCEIPSDH